ncbi:MAG: hypothetical protein JXJ18_00800 [Rhodobacteraceae bacterium]|nr:hypothetical protein [Paracoccaceae bacterium]
MTQTFRTFEDGYRGFELLLDLNWDRFLFPAAIGLALMLSAYLASI